MKNFLEMIILVLTFCLSPCLLVDVDSFILEEFQYAIKDMKSNKAADKMGLIFEMIKFGSDELHHHILKFLNLILTKGQVPEE